MALAWSGPGSQGPMAGAACTPIRRWPGLMSGRLASAAPPPAPLAGWGRLCRAPLLVIVCPVAVSRLARLREGAGPVPARRAWLQWARGKVI